MDMSSTSANRMGFDAVWGSCAWLVELKLRSEIKPAIKLILII
jgi:hypothetical protein